MLRFVRYFFKTRGDPFQCVLIKIVDGFYRLWQIRKDHSYNPIYFVRNRRIVYMFPFYSLNDGDDGSFQLYYLMNRSYFILKKGQKTPHRLKTHLFITTRHSFFSKSSFPLFISEILKIPFTLKFLIFPCLNKQFATTKTSRLSSL